MITVFNLFAFINVYGNIVFTVSGTVYEVPLLPAG